MIKPLWRLSLIWLFALKSVFAQEDTLRIQDTEAESGQKDVEVQVLATNQQPLMGLSFAASYQSGLAFKRITLEGTELGPDQLGCEYFQAIAGDGYFGAAAIIDFEEPYDWRKLESGTNHPVSSAYFDIGSGSEGEYVIDLRDDLGDPPVLPTFAVYPGEPLRPTLIDGTVTVQASQPETVNIHMGDVNGDEEINISDPIFLLNYMFVEGAPPPCAKAGDTNNDSALDISDAIGLLRYVFQGRSITSPDGSAIAPDTNPGCAAWPAENVPPFGALPGCENPCQPPE